MPRRSQRLRAACCLACLLGYVLWGPLPPAPPEMYFSEWKLDTIMLTCAMMAFSRSYASSGVRHSSRMRRSILFTTRHSLTCSNALVARFKAAGEPLQSGLIRRFDRVRYQAQLDLHSRASRAGSTACGTRGGFPSWTPALLNSCAGS